MPLLAGVGAVTGRLTEELLARPDGKSRALPIVVAVGARGTGKTALLAAVAKRCEDVPHAQVDFERHDWENVQPRELVGHLAFELGRHWRQFGRLAFPRLWLCMLVLGAPVELNDRRAALRKLRELLAKNQPLERNREAIVDVVRLAGGVAPVDGLPGLTAATDLLLRGLSWYDRRRLLGKIKALPAATGDHSDFLLGIAKQANGDEEDRATVDATFCDAFLADLRRAYSGINRSRRTLNSVLLLDNAHTPGGRAFLRVLTEARHRSPDEPDPLAVVATGRSWNPDWNESWSLPTAPPADAIDRRRPTAHRTNGLVAPTPRHPSEVDADWAPGAESPEQRWNPWYLVEVGTLGRDDVVDVAAGSDIHPASRLPGFLHRLTDGHPGAVAEVLNAVAHTYDSHRAGALRSALHTPVAGPDGGESVLLAGMREYLLQDFAPPSREDLVTASAALDVEMLFHKEILELRNPAGEGALFKELGDRLWLCAEPGDPVRYVLHPWLRRVLVQELAARAEDHSLSWVRVHTRCRDFYEKNGRTVAARYHDLALENVAGAVEHLSKPFLRARHAEFDLATAKAWLAELDVITAAPNRLDKTADPYQQVESLAGQWDDELETTLAWLVVALWIARDPLGDPGRTLDSTIEAGFHQLAQGRGRGSILVHERAERYR